MENDRTKILETRNQGSIALFKALRFSRSALLFSTKIQNPDSSITDYLSDKIAIFFEQKIETEFDYFQQKNGSRSVSIVTFVEKFVTEYRVLRVNEVHFSHVLQTRAGVDLIRFRHEVALNSSLSR